MRIHRFPHCLRTLVQAASRFARASDLSIQTEDAVNGGACVHCDLPFLPGDVQVHRLEIFPRRSLLRQKRNECAEFPAEIGRASCRERVEMAVEAGTREE